MSKGKGDLETEVYNSGPPHVEQPAWQKKLAMSEKKLKKLEGIVKLTRRISPAGEQLTFEQALSLARRNAEAYDKFLSSGAPINALEVRWGAQKELCRVIQNRADGVREVTFNRPLAEDTVLQLWRSGDRALDPVPLLFLDLERVPSQGISRTESYPNGQNITLCVRKEQDEEFKIKLSFAIDKEIFGTAKELAATEDERWETADKKSFHAMPVWKYDHNKANSNQVYAAPTNYWYYVRAAMMVLLVGFGAYFWGRYLATDKAKEDMLAQSKARAEAVQNSDAARDDSATAPADPETDDTTTAQTTGTETQQSVDPTPATHASIHRRGKPGYAEVPFSRRERPDTSNTSTPIAMLDTVAAPDPVETPDPVMSVNTVEQTYAPRKNGNTYWDRQCEARLASLKLVYVEELNDSSLDKESRIRVRAEFIKSLEGRGIKVLPEGKSATLADGIVRLRFKPDKIAGGAVFAEMHDNNDQYIWDDKAGCDTTINGSLKTVLGDASQRLGELMVAAIQHAQRNAVEQQVSQSSHTGGGGQ
jgi:hypothetical protein